MFTGIIEEVGTVRGIKKGRNVTLSIETINISDGSNIGDSISVNGACLTICAIKENLFSFHVSPETIEKSTLNSLSLGDSVNLERALKLSDRLGGHFVSGHIDSVAVIRKIDLSNGVNLFVSVSESVLNYMIYKGSVTIDGISLTISDLWDGGFTVSLIPLTFEQTTIHNKKQGDKVNIECDMVAKYVEKLVHPFQNANSEYPGKKSMITHEFLAKNGFI